MLALLLLQSVLLTPLDVPLRQFTTEHGLSSNIVEAAVQDREGYIWFGTQGGLERFDGYVFKSYAGDSTSGFMGSYVRDIDIDANGTIWVLTTEGYLNRYVRESDRFDAFPIVDSDTGFRISNAWHLMFLDKHHAMVFSIDRNPENVFKAVHMDIPSMRMRIALIPVDEAWVASQMRPGYASEMHSVQTAPDGSQWLPHSDGLMYRPRSDTLFEALDLPLIAGTVRHTMRHLSFDGDSLVWIASFNNGLMRYDRNREVLSNYRFADVSAPWHFHYAYQVIQDPSDSDVLWLGTRSNGVLRFRKSTRSFEQIRSHKAIPIDTYVLLIDRAGVVWMGGRGTGLYAMNPTVTQSARFITNQLVNGQQTPIDITDLESDGAGGFWVSTYSNGLYRLASDGSILRQLNTVGSGFLPHMSIWSVDRAKNGALWISSSAGVRVSEKADFTFQNVYSIATRHQPEGQFSRSVLSDHAGTVWVGSANGLGRSDHPASEWKAYYTDESDSSSIPENFIHTLFIDSKNRLWTGHQIGCVAQLVDKDTGRFQRYRMDRLCRVYSFHERKDGTIWVGTVAGVFRIREDLGTLEPVEWLSMVENDRVNSFHDDRMGRVWIGTTKGLVIADSASGTHFRLNAIDGFQSDAISYQMKRDEQGRVWIATFDGIVRFEDEKFDVSSFPFDIRVVEAVKLDPMQSSMNTNNRIRLGYHENDFRVAVSNFDFRDPESQTWYFRLNGLHDEWIRATSRNLMQYTSLSPGNYSLDVKVVSRYGYEQSQENVMEVDIVPAYWQTVWFRLMVFVSVLVAFGSIGYIRYRKSVEIRETRERMLHDLHDDLSSVLASVQFNVKTLQPGAEIRPAVLGRLSDSARQAGDIMRDLLWTVNPKEDQWGILVSRCKEFVAMSVDDQDIRMTWAVSGDETASVPLPLKKQFMLVFKEIVTNGCKHSKARNVAFTLALGNTLHLAVSDDGVGFDPDSARKGVGMESIRSRLAKTRAEWTLVSAPGEGTRWDIRFPLRPGGPDKPWQRLGTSN
jgi:ligand-binding sensor domain-containing protein